MKWIKRAAGAVMLVLPFVVIWAFMTPTQQGQFFEIVGVAMLVIIAAIWICAAASLIMG